MQRCTSFLDQRVPVWFQIDKEELQDARWFTRQDVIQMLNHSHPRHIYVPPEAAIAHQLIKTWVTRTANL